MKKTRAFLKWAGGKFSLIEEISERLPPGRVLLEPFVGAGSVFLNTDYEEYVLNDINPHLIDFYNHLKQSPDRLIAEARRWFESEHNNKAAYYRLRTQFNGCTDSFERSQLFLYLNRHGFNGLCRYNKKGGFNVPFGSYKKPYFPEKELWQFAEKAQRATFICENYADAMARAESDWVVYCDPPYAPLSTTASFTTYAAGGFTLDDQAVLARLARHTAAEKGVPVLISNHDIELTRELYRGARLDEVQVKRTISRNGGGRNKVAELLALYPPGISPEQGWYPQEPQADVITPV
ncbi:DNA adenine methylase [Aeromonas sp. RU39B]|uniref:Dam family site-specific DNA-(adenine-N6)-methyltransferase n=1 Tax=Aeromonas sp. RU39B TaxID=1907416 RepID=UPI000956C92F|nr:Dam family site-specific DNA-(adenine-N6)-methyltransferase [Aeromonas sp. RU39B]SIQ45102.1 DNA adenine methylase [Aeromonas sp. RU39B]